METMRECCLYPICFFFRIRNSVAAPRSTAAATPTSRPTESSAKAHTVPTANITRIAITAIMRHTLFRVKRSIFDLFLQLRLFGSSVTHRRATILQLLYPSIGGSQLLPGPSALPGQAFFSDIYRSTRFSVYMERKLVTRQIPAAVT